MQYKANYEVMHVHELEKELASLDERKSSEEANHIKELIRQGGYQPPTHIIINNSEISNKYFKWIFLFFLTVTVVLNIFVFIQTFMPAYLFAVGINGVIICLILIKSAHLRTGIKVWGALSIFGGLAGMLRLYLIPETWPIISLLQPLISISVGVLTIWLANKYVIFYENASNNTSKPTTKSVSA